MGSAVQDNKCDVVDKYLPDEVRALKTAGELPDSVKLNETEEGNEDNFEFGSGGEEEESGNESEKSEGKDDDIDDI
jgi:translation initiation factor 1A